MKGLFCICCKVVLKIKEAQDNQIFPLLAFGGIRGFQEGVYGINIKKNETILSRSMVIGL
ncbi:hypothetical protein [Persicobacter psychrovividus]|uniref:hypothetical protein n=1 Tax=Persicobacter psychrovividus TaxID=387638 RepID=UPI0030CA317A